MNHQHRSDLFKWGYALRMMHLHLTELDEGAQAANVDYREYRRRRELATLGTDQDSKCFTHDLDGRVKDRKD